MSTQTKEGKWWQFILGGILILAMGVYEYHRLAGFEETGGTLYMSAMESGMYHLFGKMGVLMCGIFGGLFTFSFGIWTLQNERGNR